MKNISINERWWRYQHDVAYHQYVWRQAGINISLFNSINIISVERAGDGAVANGRRWAITPS